MQEKIVKPIIIRDENGNQKYVLEFSRNSVRFAESQGFDITAMDAKPFSNTFDLFFYSFRKNHPTVTREQAQQVLEEIGKLTPELIERLGALYTAPLESLIGDEESRKNARMTVEF